jgi:hypothetical protein
VPSCGEKVQVVYRPTVRCPGCTNVFVVAFNGKVGCHLCDFPFEVVGINAVLNDYEHSAVIDNFARVMESTADEQIDALQAQLDSAISQNDTLREALEEAERAIGEQFLTSATHSHMGLDCTSGDCPFRRDMLAKARDAAKAALSLPISPGVELLRAARALFAYDQGRNHPGFDEAQFAYLFSQGDAAWRKDKETP